MHTNQTGIKLIKIICLIASILIISPNIYASERISSIITPESYSVESSLSHGYILGSQHLLSTNNDRFIIKIKPSIGYYYQNNQWLPSKIGIETNIQFMALKKVEFGVSLDNPFYTKHHFMSLSVANINRLPYTTNWDFLFKIERYRFIKTGEIKFENTSPWNLSMAIGIQYRLPKPQT